MKGIPIKKVKEVVTDMMIRVEMQDVSKHLGRTLLAGQAKKLSIGIAFLGNPKLCIIEEPTVGVDPQAA